jgi:ribosome-associated toxin RatA of RatAB toxin-antitoxin module
MADRTTSSIVIGMPAKDVMAVIADFDAYPEWATGVRRAEVLSQDDDGRASTVRFTLDAGVIKDSYVLGYDWNDDTRVRWDLAEAGSVISEMSGGYELADRGDSTEVTYELAVGIKIPMIGMLKRRAEKTIIDTALKGLKSRTETIGRGR